MKLRMKKSKLVILDDADNWFPVFFVILPFYLFFVNSSKI